MEDNFLVIDIYHFLPLIADQFDATVALLVICSANTVIKVMTMMIQSNDTFVAEFTMQAVFMYVALTKGAVP